MSGTLGLVYDDGKNFGLSWPTISRATLEALVAAAHARGKLAVVHIGSRQGAREALEAGADGLVHLYADAAPEEDFGSFAASRKAFVIPTLTVVESSTGVASGASLAEDESFAEYLLAPEKANLKRAFPARDGRLDLAVAQTAVRLLRTAGVPILAGSDASNPGTAHGASIHRELELLVQAGLSPVEARAAATSVPAQVFGLADRGRIAPGLRADLVLVDGDPASNIADTRKIVAVWKAGRQAERPKAPPPAPVEAPPETAASGQVSDFDDGEIGARFGTGWAVATDAIMGGDSTAELSVVQGGAEGSAGALGVQGRIVPKAPFPWAGAMFYPGSQPMAPANLSRFREIRFGAKGDGGTYQVLVFAGQLGMTPAQQPFTAGPEWTQYALPLADFSGIDGSELAGIAFTAGPGQEQFSFQIDEVQFH